ncbi:MAG: SDR family NAD(P)-dependent oxidoreductase [Terriglobales bacterium]
MLKVDLDGQVAVVSGGARGIGAATVKLLAEAGARAVFSYQANRAAAVAAPNAKADDPHLGDFAAGRLAHMLRPCVRRDICSFSHSPSPS